MVIMGGNILSELPIPVHDKEVIDESVSTNVTVTYYFNSRRVATKTIATSGAITTISVTY
jgi:hypothetical protein